MVEGVLVTDLTGGVVLLNSRARDLLALPPDASPRGRPLVELTRDPALGELMRELAAGAGIASRDVTLSAGTGPTLQVNAARLRGVDGEAFGFVLVLHDVTELRRLEVIRRDFVANVSHELRTPLTAIKGYAETLLGSAGDDRETARRFLAIIDRHSERLGRLIDDLLTLSDLELGRTPMRLNAVTVGSAVDDVLQIFAKPVARAGVRVEAQVATSLPPVHADGDRLRQSGARSSSAPCRRRARSTPAWSRSRSRTPVSAFPPRTCRASRSASSASTRRARASWAAPASVWRS
jgi:two-component system phosphate regulon sensor histidine kinase PhoR